MTGDGGPGAFYETIGLEPDALQADWNRYVLKLKAR